MRRPCLLLTRRAVITGLIYPHTVSKLDIPAWLQNALYIAVADQDTNSDGYRDARGHGDCDGNRHPDTDTDGDERYGEPDRGPGGDCARA